jgi:outer membrane protein OmpA-like peptidoglycan-associated protein/Mg-chelatase subunit ChlD
MLTRIFHHHRSLILRYVLPLKPPAMLVCMLVSMLALSGCPHHIEQTVEKMRPPADHKPKYMMSSVSLSKYAKSTTASIGTNVGANSSPNAGTEPSLADLRSLPSASTSMPRLSELDLASTASTSATSATSGATATSSAIPATQPTIITEQALKRLGLSPATVLDSSVVARLQTMKLDSSITNGSTTSTNGTNASNSANASNTGAQNDLAVRDAIVQAWQQRTAANETRSRINAQNAYAASVYPDLDILSEPLSSTSKQSAQSIPPSDPSEEAAANDDANSGGSKRARRAAKRKKQAAQQSIPQAPPQTPQAPPQKQLAASTGAASEPTLGMAEEGTSASTAPQRKLFSLEIRSVDDHRYPDEVEIQAVVLDTAGRFVTGLAPTKPAPNDLSFRRWWRALSDSTLPSITGAANRIQNFRVQEVRETLREPNAIAFVLDHSGSMGDGRARRLQEAVRQLMNLVRGEDRIAVVKFDNRINVEVPLTQDSSEYKRRLKINGLEEQSGGTALYDGALAGIDEVAKAPAGVKKTVIVFSDGDDNDSKKRLRDVYRAAYAKGVKVHTVGYGLTNEEPMERIATTSGGKFYRVYSSREFPFVFADIYRSLKNYYRITYKPPQIASLHTARVGVIVPELGDMRLAAQGNYDRSLVTAVDTIGTVKPINIEFESGKAIVRSESLPELRDFARSLLQSPDVTIEIRGHTDDRGSGDLNQKLSEDRATAVAAELGKMGIAANRFTTRGFGKSQPLAPNDSDDNRRRNRRTEFVITGGVK